jgi:hypothetical protein
MKRRTIALILVWTLPSVLFLAATGIVYSAYRIPPPDRVDEAERTQVIASLRAGLEDKPAIPCDVRHEAEGPLAVTVWYQGRAAVRVDANGDDVGKACDAAAELLRKHASIRAFPDPAEFSKMRLQVDVITGTAPLGHGQWLFDALAVPGVGDMMAINSGVEGIGLEWAGKPQLMLPHELVATKLLTTKRPSAALQDFAMGADLDKLARVLAARANQTTAIDTKKMFRFRTDTFVETPGKAPLQLYRGIPAAPPLTAKTLRDFALDGGRFLVAHLAPNGRYIYEHDLATGAQTDPKSASYSMPRHAGTTYFLAELYRITKKDKSIDVEWLREPIERAFAHLAELMAGGRCAKTLPDGTEIDCVLDRTERVAHLGSTALTVVALAEYQRATGDNRYMPMTKKLAAFLLYMQRDDGSFRHLYNSTTKEYDDKSQLLYYSGEASLALARMHEVTKDPIYAKAAEKGLDWLVDWYDFFMAGFFYGEEHWTCIASEAAWPAAKNPKWKDFCHGYGKFLRQQQASAGDHPDQDDFAGAYVFTPFLVPYNTPAGSRTEAMISSYLLGRHHGTPDADVKAQIRAALQYALGQQIRSDNAFAVIGPGQGGMPGSPIDRSVRIDFVQHVCSAFIRASEFIDE